MMYWTKPHSRWIGFLNSLISFWQNLQYILIYGGVKLKEKFFFLLLLVNLEEDRGDPLNNEQ